MGGCRLSSSQDKWRGQWQLCDWLVTLRCYRHQANVCVCQLWPRFLLFLFFLSHSHCLSFGANVTLLLAVQLQQLFPSVDQKTEDSYTCNVFWGFWPCNTVFISYVTSLLLFTLQATHSLTKYVFCVQLISSSIISSPVTNCLSLQFTRTSLRFVFFTNYFDYFSRLGESAAGDRISSHFPVSGVDSVPGPPPLSPLPHLHLDFQMAHRSHHAGSCE